MGPLAPVLLFTYNRPAHTRATLDALARCELASRSDLIVFSDAPRSEAQAPAVREVRDVIARSGGFASKTIVAREKNLGLSRSIISGVSERIGQRGSVIVLEDDLEVAPGFLIFMNEALDRYRGNPRVFAISGWAPELGLPADFPAELYASRRGLCWGWATWQDRWDKVDWEVKDYANFARDRRAQKEFALGGDDLPDMLRNSVEGRNDSWAVRWAYAQFRLGMISLVPKLSYVHNGGQDDSGENSKSKYLLREARLSTEPRSPRWPDSVEPDPISGERLRRFYGYNWKAKVRKFFGLL